MSPRLLREIPCDLSTISYCTQPGSAYPWSAVRRYIYENQGFMKRMYGESRQSQIIREEMHRMSDQYNTIDVAAYRMAKSGFFDGSSATTNSTNDNETSIISDQRDNDLSEPAGAVFLLNVTTNENKIELEEPIITSDKQSESEPYSTTAVDNLTNLYASMLDVTDEHQDIPSTLPTDTENLVPEEKPEKSTKGYNACPINQEVVAPYWANNTRGETLALLNVYPFEQYIHWEKCSFEGEQMLCREGCRCEQQYRLHRLLAFDPKNECRGIFSDWFRFPGCCVCICYENHGRINNRKARL